MKTSSISPSLSSPKKISFIFLMVFIVFETEGTKMVNHSSGNETILFRDKILIIDHSQLLSTKSSELPQCMTPRGLSTMDRFLMHSSKLGQV